MHSRAGEDSADEDLSGDEESDEEGVRRGGRVDDVGGLVEDVVTVAIVPGEGWDASAATDEDSDQEEDPAAKGRKLPRNILAGEAKVTHKRMNQAGARSRPVLGEEDDTQEEETQEEEEVGEEWGPEPGLLGVNIHPYEAPIWTDDQEEQLEACHTALDWYKVFSSSEWLQHVVEQSRNYAVAMGRASQLTHITADNIR